MRPPAPRPESKSVTATPRVASSDAHTAPDTAIVGRSKVRIAGARQNGLDRIGSDRIVQLFRNQRCGKGREIRLSINAAYFRLR
jgi:hypothetical protein